MRRIELVFQKAITRLTGNPYGREIFEKQVKNIIDYDDKIEIIFPKQIIMISSSFVQGFFDEMVSEIGLAEVEKNVSIIAPGLDVDEVIWDNLRY